jgi:fumarylpyruvate hydrolase
MNPLLFPAPPLSTLPVRGQPARVPIRRIFCVGRNYEAHAKEMGVAVDREAPFYFTKSAEHYLASGSTAPYALDTTNYHYEMELVAVIGAPAFRVPAEVALDAVFGYACGLDMTRRDLQLAAREQRRPWDLGKDVEQSAVISEIVANLSTFYHLNPGDVIFTGTPEGVGPVKPGDRIEGSIAGIGAIALTMATPE